MIGGPLKWHGGKAYLASRIVAMMPPHLHYVEPYFGGGSVLLAKNPEGVSEVANDLNGDLMNLWHTLADESLFARFCRIVQAVPFCESVWEHNAHASGLDGVDAAVAFFIKCRQSLAGRMDAFASISRNRVRRGMNEQVSAWLTCVEGLPEVHARMKRVVILNRDALHVIRQQDGVNTLFYLDPPYLHETRSTTGEYTHEMTADQHLELLNLLGSIEGRFMLSGYRSDMYDSAERDYGWICTEFDLPNNAAGGKEKQRKTECVWMNFLPSIRETA